MSLLKSLSKEIQFNAYYDPVSDTIHNAKENSYTWFHEKRHQKQIKRAPIVKTLNTWFYIAGYSLAGGFFVAHHIGGFSRWDIAFMLVGLAWLPLTLLNLVLEIDAFIFGTLDWISYKAK